VALCDGAPKKKNHEATLSRSGMRRRLNRRSQCVERLKSKNDELQQQVQDLQNRLSDNTRKLKMANAQLAMRSSVEPSHDAIKQWPRRLGVASLQNTFTRDDRVLWMADHSSQIGKERLLVIVGVALDDLPPPEQTLSQEIGRGERFKPFVSEVGLTRNRVQQTELDQFAPPTLRSKSRFMNVGKLFEWAMMLLYHLNHPSACKVGIRDERMEEKLGWLREYADDLASWNQCQKVIDESLRVINTMGLDEHMPKLVEQALDELNPSWRQDDSSAARIGVKLIAWIEHSASKLKTGERAWLSTEVLESLFGKFKQMERQHSKGGFTRLIAAIPTLCLQVTREQVRDAFGRIDSKATRKWMKDTLGKSLTARRNAAYREYLNNTRDHDFLAA